MAFGMGLCIVQGIASKRLGRPIKGQDVGDRYPRLDVVGRGDGELSPFPHGSHARFDFIGDIFSGSEGEHFLCVHGTLESELGQPDSDQL